LAWWGLTGRIPGVLRGVKTALHEGYVVRDVDDDTPLRVGDPGGRDQDKSWGE